MYYKITYNDGDTVSSRINASEQEIRKLFPVGQMQNVGTGPDDCFKKIVHVEVSAEQGEELSISSESKCPLFGAPQKISYTLVNDLAAHCARFCPECGLPLTKEGFHRSSPLTPEELKQMNGYPVFIVCNDNFLKGKSGYAILYWRGATQDRYTYFSMTGTPEGMTATPVFESGYGKTWLAYLRPPKDYTI